MKEDRLRSARSSARNFLQRFLWIVLLPGLLFVEIVAQQSNRQTNSSQKELLARLASSDEEQRLDAVLQMGAFLRDATDSAETPAITALSNALQQDSSPVVRALAARALELGGGNQFSDKIVPALIAALGKEREGAVRKAIIYALAHYPQPQVTAVLIPLLDDKNSELRAAAAYALAESGDASATQPLIEALRKRGGDEDAFARSQAARGLGRIGDRDSINPLLEALTRDKSQEVRRDAATALGRIAARQDAKVIEALRNAALSNDPYLVAAADNAIASVNARNP